MSLAIQCDDVTEVLLEDGWHKVLKKSFSIDAYEYLWGEQLLYNGEAGFHFYGMIDGKKEAVYGQLIAIKAVRTK